MQISWAIFFSCCKLPGAIFCRSWGAILRYTMAKHLTTKPYTFLSAKMAQPQYAKDHCSVMKAKDATELATSSHHPQMKLSERPGSSHRNALHSGCTSFCETNWYPSLSSMILKNKNYLRISTVCNLWVWFYHSYFSNSVYPESSPAIENN